MNANVDDGFLEDQPLEPPRGPEPSNRPAKYVTVRGAARFYNRTVSREHSLRAPHASHWRLLENREKSCL